MNKSIRQDRETIRMTLHFPPLLITKKKVNLNRPDTIHQRGTERKVQKWHTARCKKSMISGGSWKVFNFFTPALLFIAPSSRSNFLLSFFVDFSTSPQEPSAKVYPPERLHFVRFVFGGGFNFPAPVLGPSFGTFQPDWKREWINNLLLPVSSQLVTWAHTFSEGSNTFEWWGNKWKGFIDCLFFILLFSIGMCWNMEGFFLPSTSLHDKR